MYEIRPLEFKPFYSHSPMPVVAETLVNHHWIHEEGKKFKAVEYPNVPGWVALTDTYEAAVEAANNRHRKVVANALLTEVKTEGNGMDQEKG